MELLIHHNQEDGLVVVEEELEEHLTLKELVVLAVADTVSLILEVVYLLVTNNYLLEFLPTLEQLKTLVVEEDLMVLHHPFLLEEVEVVLVV